MPPEAVGEPATTVPVSAPVGFTSWRRELRRAMRLTRLLAHTLFGAVIAVTALGPLVRRRRHDAVVRWWVRGILRILNVRLEVDGDISTETTLFAANHVSWLDIPCLRAVLDAEFVAKQEVARWPVIGRMARRAGTLFLHRGERDASFAAANAMGRALGAGRSVVIFPEGTTGDGRRLGHFHARLYQAAIRARRPVQAVAVTYPYPDDVQGCARVGRSQHPASRDTGTSLYGAGDTTPRMDDPRDGEGSTTPGAVAGQLDPRPEPLPRRSGTTGIHPAVPFVGDDNLGRHVWVLLAEDVVHVRILFCPPIETLDERRRLAERSRAQIAVALGLEPAIELHRDVIAV
jgi:1-acyl-sn-glycerol-3-phosphate acyltransferase